MGFNATYPLISSANGDSNVLAGAEEELCFSKAWLIYWAANSSDDGGLHGIQWDPELDFGGISNLRVSRATTILWSL